MYLIKQFLAGSMALMPGAATIDRASVKAEDNHKPVYPVDHCVVHHFTRFFIRNSLCD